MPPPPRTTTEALLARCKPDPDGDCLIWTGATTNKGAPLVRINHQRVPVRRLLLELRDGKTLGRFDCAVTEPGCHDLCCNPAHLRAVAQAERINNVPRPPTVKRAPAAAASIFALAQSMR